MSAPPAQGLQMRTIPAPAGMVAPAQVYSSPAATVSHLLNHVLLAPECHGWELILPDWALLLGAEGTTERHNFRARLTQTAGTSAQELYDDQTAALAQDLRDGEMLGWRGEQDHTVVCFGSRGILLVFERTGQPVARTVLVTAFLPGLGDPSEVAAAQRDNRPRRPTARESCRRRRCLGGGWDHPRDQRDRVRREGRWTRAEAFFYRVFRPACRFLRGEYVAARDLDGLPLVRHYHLVYPHLPNVSRMDPADWVAIRCRCGHREDES